MSTQDRTLFQELSDPNHPDRQREWDTFMQRRTTLMEDLIGKLGLTAATRDIGAASQLDQQALADALQQREQANAEFALKPQDMRMRDYQQLLGAAQTYNIPQPETLDVGQLMAQIEQARIRRVEARDAGTPGFWDENVNLLDTSYGAYATGTIDALGRVLETIPWLGDWASDTETMQNLNRQIGLVREASSGGLHENELFGFRVGEAVSGMAAYIPIGFGAWRLAGSVLGSARLSGAARATGGRILDVGASGAVRVLSELTPAFGLAARSTLLHNALQGGLASVMLEAGGDGSIEERVTNIAFGLGLGAAFDVGGKVGVAAFGATAGGVVGAASGEENGALIGAAGGAAAALGGHRLYRMFARRASLGGNYAQWFDSESPQYPGRDPNIVVPAIFDEPSFQTSVRHRQLESGPRPQPQQPGALMSPQGPAGLLPEQALTSQGVERYSFRGNKTLFMPTNEAPDALIARWNDIEVQGFTGGDDPLVNSVRLDNTGRLIPGAVNVHEVEVKFKNAFVLTPQSAPLFRQLTDGAQDEQGIRTALLNRGFDGYAVQGVDDMVAQMGPVGVVESLGIPPSMLEDHVVAFGSPNQVRFAKTIVDGELLDRTFQQFGSKAGRQIAGIQSARMANDAARRLRPFEVGDRPTIPPAPVWLSEQRGVMFDASEGLPQHPLVPPNVKHAVVQHHPDFGPRVVLLDGDRVAVATFPAITLGEAYESMTRLGFNRMNPNSEAEAIKLAHRMSRADLFLNNSYLDRIAQSNNMLDADLIPIAYADNPGRLTVISGVDDPIELRRVLNERITTFDPDFDPQANLHIVERPAGTFHALVGPADLITPKAVSQFKEFGVFSGVQARTLEGLAVRVNTVWREGNRERASISPLYSDVKATVPLGYIMPEMFTASIPLPGNLYTAFEKFAVKQFNVQASAAGIDPALSLTDPRVLSFTDRYLEQFAASKGVTSRYELERMANSLEYNLAQEYQRLAGEDGQIAQALSEEAADAMTRSTLSGNMLEPAIEDMAVVKGFVWEPPYQGKHGQLVDQSSNLVVPFATQDSAKAFLIAFNRSAFDVTPRGAETMEALQAFPQTHTHKTTSGVEFADDASEWVAREGTARQAAKAADDLQASVEMAAELEAAIARATPEERAAVQTRRIADKMREQGLTPDPDQLGLAYQRFLQQELRMQSESGSAGTLSSPIAPLSQPVASQWPVSLGGPRPPQGAAGPAVSSLPEGLPPRVDLFGAPPLPPQPPIPPRGGPLVPDDGENFMRGLENAMRPRLARPAQNEIDVMLENINQTYKQYPDKLLALQDAMDRPLRHYLAPMRTYAELLDDHMRSVGIEHPRLFEHVDGFLQDKSIAINAAIPWMQKMWNIVTKFDRRDRRTGPLYEVMTASSAPNAAIVEESLAKFGKPYASEQDYLMAKYEFTPEQVQAVSEMRAMMNELHAEAADFADLGYIFDYLPRLRHFMDLHGPEKAWAAWHKILPNEIKWFARYAREGHLDNYQKDVGRVLSTYIHGLFFEKHAGASFMRAKETWTDPRIPPSLRVMMENWLFTARHGHPPGHDPIVRGVRSMVNSASAAVSKVTGVPMPKVTDGEVLNALGIPLTVWYRGFLGFSPHVIVREFMQPFLLAPKLGMGTVAKGYAKYLANPEARAVWRVRAAEHGWAEPNRNAVVNSEFFTGELMQEGVDPTGKVVSVSMFSPDVLRARESVARVMDRVVDFVPHKLRVGIEGDPVLDPLHAYRVLATGPGREIAGNTGYERARESILAWRRGEIDYATMMDQSDAAHQSASARAQFEEFLRQGADESAAIRMGTEASKTQFMFGIAEQSEAIRNSGIGGRYGMNFGNFSNQFGWEVAGNVKRRGGRAKWKYIATLGALTALPEIGAEVTGWEGLRKFNWFRSLLFGGGPLVEPMLGLIPASVAARKTITGDPLSPEEAFAASRFGDLWGDLLTHPYGGATRTMRTYINAMGSMNPAENFFRATLTGESGAASVDRFMNQFEQRMERNFQQQFFPQSVPPMPQNLAPVTQSPYGPPEEAGEMELIRGPGVSPSYPAATTPGVYSGAEVSQYLARFSGLEPAQRGRTGEILPRNVPINSGVTPAELRALADSILGSGTGAMQ